MIYESILDTTGISADATLTAAFLTAENTEPGSIMLPDTGERNLSTYFFDNVHDDSDDEWSDSL